MFNLLKKEKGFTIIELSVVFAIILILIGISSGVLFFFRDKLVLSSGAEEFAQVLRLAQNKTIASKDDSVYGVYINNESEPNEYTLFLGQDYESRDSSFDVVYELDKALEFDSLDFGSEGSAQVVFERITGKTFNSGSVSIVRKSDPSQGIAVHVSSDGTISFEEMLEVEDTRLKDSRHVHVDYSRFIDVETESIFLSFEDGLVTETIPIFNNMETGQFYWEGEINVSGDVQELKIQTHRLNNTDTQFSIHRDRRYNNKSLKVFVLGDGGFIAEYSSDGLVTDPTSIHVTGFSLQ